MFGGWKMPLRLALLCVVAFVLVLVAAYWLPIARWADGWAVDGFLSLQRPWLSRLAYHVAHLANPVPFVLATVALAVVALVRRRPRHALAVLALLIGANVIAQVLKTVLEHDRYHGFLGHAQLSSTTYPSGHATASMSLAYAAVLVAPAAWRRVVALGGALFALAVSESIMLLAWHFPSDVLGGFLLATACALATVAALRAADARWPERSGRTAAKRAFGGLDLRRMGTTAGVFVGLVLLVGVLAAGERMFAFADRHTTAVAAAALVAALAAMLPLGLAGWARGARDA